MEESKKMDRNKPSKTYFADTERHFPGPRVNPKSLAIQPKPLMNAWSEYVALDHTPKTVFDPKTNPHGYSVGRDIVKIGHVLVAA